MSKYNERPLFWRQIKEEEFARFFFMYIIKAPESRQMHRDADGNKIKYIGWVRLFETTYPGWEGLGVAIVWKPGEGLYFYKYGDPDIWEEKQRKFAAQFMGDNS